MKIKHVFFWMFLQVLGVEAQSQLESSILEEGKKIGKKAESDASFFLLEMRKISLQNDSKKKLPVKNRWAESTLLPSVVKPELCKTCSSQNLKAQESSSKQSYDLFLLKAQILVFISFSLGDETLKKLYYDASRIGGKLILQGLFKESFKETQEKVKNLGIIVEIDPPLFDLFQIKHVPTIVLAKNDDTPFHKKSLPLHDRIMGNVSLTYALEEFMKEGELKREASIFLEKLKGKIHES